MFFTRDIIDITASDIQVFSEISLLIVTAAQILLEHMKKSFHLGLVITENIHCFMNQPYRKAMSNNPWLCMYYLPQITIVATKDISN